ncbi:MAG TPA: LacI family DNA-binding transcriptional regulator [Candidatus Onthovicinus excrementipullorum]|nr:LacI family DNA-binding transcriptional regulator [Candidatus Onthovicinus excrementipullorum]
MAVTIKQIAERAGVSRGTVDRALNGRGRIAPQRAEQILKLAAEMGYVPKTHGKGRAARRRIRIGVVTQLAHSSFMLEVNRGIRRAAEELRYRGGEVILKEGPSVDEAEQLRAIEELEAQGIGGLAIMPVECERVRKKLNDLIDAKGVPVVTFNSDIVGTNRLCFVGMDNRASGRTAAGLLGLMTRGSGKVLIITGYFSNHVDNQRVDGFIDELKNSYPGMEIAGVHGSFDETSEVARIIESTMISTAGISGILVASGGQAGIAKAFEKLKLDKRPYVVIYDQTPKNEKILREGTADFLIDQNGYVQGYRPPHILADLLIRGQKPEQEYLFTEIRIKTKYNL